MCVEPLDGEHAPAVGVERLRIRARYQHELRLEGHLRRDTESLQAFDLGREERPRIAGLRDAGIVGQFRERLGHAGSMWESDHRRGIGDGAEIPGIRPELRVRDLLIGDREVPVRHREGDAVPRDLLEPTLRHRLRPTEARVVVIDDPQRVGTESRQPGHGLGGLPWRVDRCRGFHCRLHGVAA